MAIPNKILVEYHISEYKKIISELKNEISSLKLKIKVPEKESEECKYCRDTKK